MAARIRTSDREELNAKRDELRRRVDVLDAEFRRTQERIPQVREQAQTARRERDAAAEVLRQAEASMTRAELNLKVLADQQAKNGERLEEVRRELSEIEALIGKQRTEQGLPARESASEQEALEVASRFGTFGHKDLAAVLKVSPAKAKALANGLVEKEQLKALGTKILGQDMFEYVPTGEQQAAAETEAIKLGRDWICAQKAAFTRAQVKVAAELTDTETDAVIEWARGKGVLKEVGIEGAEIFQYDPPKEAGRAAQQDMRRRPRESVGGRGGGAPVAGTGSGLKINDPDVRALVSACEKLGATVKKAGDGHLRVEYQGRSVNIASTPSTRRTVLNDRARVRRNLGLQLAG